MGFLSTTFAYLSHLVIVHDSMLYRRQFSSTQLNTWHKYSMRESSFSSRILSSHRSSMTGGYRKTRQLQLRNGKSVILVSTGGAVHSVKTFTFRYGEWLTLNLWRHSTSTETNHVFIKRYFWVQSPDWYNILDNKLAAGCRHFRCPFRKAKIVFCGFFGICFFYFQSVIDGAIIPMVKALWCHWSQTVSLAVTHTDYITISPPDEHGTDYLTQNNCMHWSPTVVFFPPAIIIIQEANSLWK